MKRNTIILIAIGIILLLLGLNWAKIITITAEQTYFAGAILAIVGLVMAWQHLKNSSRETNTNNMPIFDINEVYQTCLDMYKAGGSSKILGKTYDIDDITFQDSDCGPLFIKGRLAFYYVWYPCDVSHTRRALTVIRKLSDSEFNSVENVTKKRYVVAFNSFSANTNEELIDIFNKLKIMLDIETPEIDISLRSIYPHAYQPPQQQGGQYPPKRPVVAPPTYQNSQDGVEGGG